MWIYIFRINFTIKMWVWVAYCQWNKGFFNSISMVQPWSLALPEPFVENWPSSKAKGMILVEVDASKPDLLWTSISFIIMGGNINEILKPSQTWNWKVRNFKTNHGLSQHKPAKKKRKVSSIPGTIPEALKTKRSHGWTKKSACSNSAWKSWPRFAGILLGHHLGLWNSKVWRDGYG